MSASLEIQLSRQHVLGESFLEVLGFVWIFAFRLQDRMWPWPL